MILERDGNDCVWCRRAFDNHLVLPTTEHLVPRIKGGPVGSKMKSPPASDATTNVAIGRLENSPMNVRGLLADQMSLELSDHLSA